MKQNKALPNILILSTGGTIAGTASSETKLGCYTAGAVSVSTLLAELPILKQYASIQTQAIAQIDSKDMQFEVWEKLATSISYAQQDKTIDGVVVVHGTDTLEETAYFLHLSIALTKPLVIVGAMRPMTALSADGPLNLLHAIRLAAYAPAKDKGPLVVNNQQIFTAYEVTKASAHQVDAFCAPGQGPLGRIFDDEIIWLRQPFLSSSLIPFSANANVWPWVEILTHCTGAYAKTIDALVDAGVQGIILAGTGSGTLSDTWLNSARKAHAAGVVVIRATRCWLGPVLANIGCNDSDYGTLPAGELTPQKARILLMLGLRNNLHQDELTQLFKSCTLPVSYLN